MDTIRQRQHHINRALPWFAIMACIVTVLGYFQGEITVSGALGSYAAGIALAFFGLLMANPIIIVSLILLSILVAAHLFKQIKIREPENVPQMLSVIGCIAISGTLFLEFFFS